MNFCCFEVYDFASLGLWQKFSGTACFEALYDTKIRAALFGSQFGQLECVVSVSSYAHYVKYWKMKLFEDI